MVKYFSIVMASITLIGCGGSLEKPIDTSLECSSYVDQEVAFTVNASGQQSCYNTTGISIVCPSIVDELYGQDAQYSRNEPNFTVCDSSVVVDKNTNLFWQKAHNEVRVNYATAETACDALELGGFSDWRLPDAKEAFSIVNFAGTIDDSTSTSPSNPYIFDQYFDIGYDATLALSGSHQIQMMGQTWTATPRPDNSSVNYFYNFLDGHMKSQSNSNPDVALFYRCVRGEQSFSNDFASNDDNTVTDNATGLMWQSENGYNTATANYQFNWSEALNYCESSTVAEHTDWRLPDVKELQSIVDYTDATNSIDTSVFTHIVDADTGPFFWSSTTDEETPRFADYVCFGPCWNYLMNADIHGPGAQRSSPKYDNGRLPESLGDQEDLVQVDNYVRCVR